MKKKFRLAKRTDFERVRREGTSYAHPLIVLVTLPNNLTSHRVGVGAGRSVGNAVTRNRAKRRMREAIRLLAPYIVQGFDLLFIARQPQNQASFHDLQTAIYNVLFRANLILKEINA